MLRLAIYLLYLAGSLRSAIQIAARRDPAISIGLLVVFGLLLFTEPWISQRLASRSPRAPARYHVIYLLMQIGLILGVIMPRPTPDTPLVLFLPLAFQVVEFFGWRVGRWWIAAFLAPMLAYALRHNDDLNNLIMAPVFESGCLLLGGLAHLTHKAQAARLTNLRMAGELQAAQAELQKYTMQVEELAAEKARTLFARELHDSVTQTAFSMNLAVEAARLMLPRGPAAAAEQLDRVQSLSQNALAEIGKLVSHLGPPSSDSRGLLTGITRLVESCRAAGDLNVDLQAVDTSRELPPATSSSLCQIVQEALTNIKKHAGASQASIRLDLSASPAWMEVEDCGRGFDLQRALDRPGHLGLVEMAERAREIGWRLSIDSQPGRGTRVRIEEALDGEQ